MTDPQVALLMLGLLILVILLGFPICFTLVAMGVGFGFYAYFRPGLPWLNNNIFDLLVNQTYSVMTNDVLVAVPLFLFMGYILERANIVDQLFVSLNVAARRVPASMAVAALATCALFATAVGIIGAVVTLMGLLALPALLKAGYDTKLAAGVICAGGCLGILIPPSIMLIVYAATAGVSIVQAYSAAMFPGLMLAGLYILYVMARALINPSVAPRPSHEETQIPKGESVYLLITSFVPLAILIMAVLGAILFGWATPTEAASLGAFFAIVLAGGYRIAAILAGKSTPAWVAEFRHPPGGWFEIVGVGVVAVAAVYLVPFSFYLMVGDNLGLPLPEQHTFPGGPGLSVLIALVVAFAVRLGSARSAMLARLRPETAVARALMRAVGVGASVGLVVGILYAVVGQMLDAGGFLGQKRHLSAWSPDIGFFVGGLAALAYRGVEWNTLKESVFLTVRTSAMVCWLFVGSWTFSSVFSYLGGHSLIEKFVLGLDLSPVTFLIIAQIIVFLLGWPLEWSEIIIIFVPIFLPLLKPFHIDPLFFGILVAVNLQTSFMTPPMAMAAYYLKGVAPRHVQLIQIFRGCIPFVLMVVLCMVILYNFQEIALWLPNYIYGK